ncbi:MAG: CPBP family intramembrane glutamic endopeptidase [Saprospiraceae bacterium]
MTKEQAFLLMTLSVATIGFSIWYNLSSSLRLPVRYQVMYDSNPPYVQRIFRRRMYGLIIYALIPLYIISCTKWLKGFSLNEIQLFNWSNNAGMYTLIGVAIMVFASFTTAPRQTSLEQYPDVRIRFWEPRILILSSIWWILYIAAFEFFYRGLLLQSFLINFNGNVPLAIAASTSLYCLSQYFRRNRVSFFTIIYGIVACYITLKTESIFPTIITHLTLSLLMEWLSILHHREMYVRRT